jgi:methylated-DNA-[protein]-cysteine S-methyltransferase
MSTLYERSFDSPVGRLRLIATQGALVGVYCPDHVGVPAYETQAAARHDLLSAAAGQLGEYFAGERLHFDLPIQPIGTEFQRAVWALLLKIPFGSTRSYGQLATTLGRPGASRAVGAANGRNPLSILVPCHRVIGANGKLTGYAGGVPTKQWLLDHESRALNRSPALAAG